MSEQNQASLCESVQEFWVHETRGWTDSDLSMEDATAHLAVCEDCREANQADVALHATMGQWSHSVEREASSRKGADQRLERHLIQLVREDVERRFRESSFRNRLRQRAASMGASWRELARTSPSFRTLTAAALLLALVLVGFLALDLAGRPADLGAQDDQLPVMDEPVQRHFSIGPAGDRDLRRQTNRLPTPNRDGRLSPRKK